MDRTKRPCGVPPLAAVALVALASIAPAAVLEAQAPGGGTVVATATVHAGGVDLNPEVRHSGGVVTVSGNGMVFQQRIEAGAGASIGVFDLEGQLLPDGVYTWELELYPDARTAKRLRESALRNAGRAPEAWQRLTGTLTIRNGLVAAPDLVEAGPGPRPASVGAVPMTLAGPTAARGPAVDDDAAVGSRKGAEAEVNAAALRSQPRAAAAGHPRLEGAGLERSDAAALAVGKSLEPALAPDSALREAAPARRSIFDNTDKSANGRDRSDKR